MRDAFTTIFNSPESAAGTGQVPSGRKRGAFPVWLRLAWFYSSPLGLVFASRIAWEKTVWTIVRGPQMVGFSLMHIHPMFFIGGMLCCIALILWLVPAAAFLIAHRNRISGSDIAMIGSALFAAAAMFVPDAFFASAK